MEDGNTREDREKEQEAKKRRREVQSSPDHMQVEEEEMHRKKRKAHEETEERTASHLGVGEKNDMDDANSFSGGRKTNSVHVPKHAR